MILRVIFLFIVLCKFSFLSFSQKKFNVIIDSIIYDNGSSKIDYLYRDSIIRSHLIGTWVDQNSETTYRKNGKYVVTFNNWQEERGEWEVENGILFYIPNGNREIILNGKTYQNKQPYRILSFSSSEMRTKIASDTTIWISRKIK